MADFQELGLRFVPVNDAAANKALTDVAANSDKAEVASKKLTATQQSAANAQRMVAEANRLNTSALGQMAQAIQAADAAQRAALASTKNLGAAVQTAAAQAKAASVSFNTFYDAAERDFSTQYVRQAGKAAVASKLMGHEVLNLTRQISDIGVTAAMGMNPLMILIQQGPQIGETLSMAKARGVSFSAALREMAVAGWAAVAPLAPFIVAAGAVAAVLGGGLLLATKELNDQHKDLAKGLGLTEEQLKKVKNEGVTAGDVLKGTFLAAGAALKEAFAPQLEWLSNAFSATYQFILKATLGAVEGVVKAFGGAIGILTGLWKNFPAIVGDAVVSGANLALAAVEKLVNGAIGLLNKLIGQANALSAKVGGPQFSSLANASVGRIANGNAGALSNLAADQAKGEAAALAGLAGAYKAVEASILKVATARIREEAGTAKATKAVADHTKALKDQKQALDRTQPIAADMSKAVDLSETKAVKMAAAIRELNSDLKQMPVYIDPAIQALEDFQKASDGAANGVDQFFNGLANRDWAGAVGGLIKAFDSVKKAYESASKLTGGLGGKANGIAGGIGAVAGAAAPYVSGVGGSVLSGVSAGAAIGSVVPIIGTAIGAIVGGIAGLVGGLFGQAKAKKQAAAEAAQRELDRQAQILQQRRQIEVAYVEATGTALEILEAQRKAELEGIDESNKAMALALYAAQDQKRRDEEGISLMRQLQAMDDAVAGTTVALTAAREEEVKALDPANRYLAELIYKRQDEADLIAKTAAAAAEAEAAKAAAAEKAAATQATQIGLMRQLQAMDDAVLGTNVALLANRADELAKLDDVSQGLQKIIWAREDEAKIIQANSAALEAANAKAAEILKQRTSLEDQLRTAMGRTAEVTARQRASVIDGLDPSLRGLQSAYDALTDANARVTAAETGVADARSALTEAYDRESSALKTTIDRFKGFADSLRAFRSQLMTGDLAANSPSLQYSRTKADFERVAGLASQGNEKALGDLQGVSEAYLKASGDYQRTNVGYLRDLSAVKIATKAAEGYASQQVDTATAQLAALDASVSGLMTVNASVLSVRDAIAGMSAALSELARANANKGQADAAAQAALQASKVAGVTIGANDNADVAAAKALYLSSNGGISSDLFNRYVGANPFATMKRLGYDGDPEALRKKYNFGTGGSFTVGGIGSGDTQNFGDVNLSPGEVVNVSREDSMAAMVTEIRALRSEVASLRGDTAKTAQNTAKTANTLTRVTRDGDSLITEAA